MNIAARWASIAIVAVTSMVTLPAREAGAAYLVDSGTPNQSSNLAVLYINSQISQYVAQQFTLTSAANITTIEAYLGGFGGPIRMDLSTAIGAAASSSDVIASFSLTDPGTTPNAGAWVSSNFNAQLSAGVYYLVFSSTKSDGSYLPISSPNSIGTTYFSTQANLASPVSSNFSVISSQIGIRISGTSTGAVPEPSSLALCGISGILGLGAAWKRRMRAA